MKKTRVLNTMTQHPRWVVLYLIKHYHIRGQLDNTFFKLAYDFFLYQQEKLFYLGVRHLTAVRYAVVHNQSFIALL
jgi:hypothetical protein